MTDPTLFPATIAMKVFIIDSENIKNTVINLVKKSFPELSDDDISLAHSSSQKYLSITFKILVNNQEEIDALYKIISQHPDVKMVL